MFLMDQGFLRRVICSDPHNGAATTVSPARAFTKEQACVMVAVLDDKDQVLPGFEAGKSVIQNEDRRDIPLRWGDGDASGLAGKSVDSTSTCGARTSTQ